MRRAALIIASIALFSCSSSSSDGSPSDGGSDGSTRAPKQHRPSAVACEPSKPPPGGPCSGGVGSGECKADGDCTAGTNGHCAASGGGALICRCFYDTCSTDAQCTSGGPCACSTSPYQTISNGCASGSCKVDGDCGAGGFCSPSPSTGCSGGLEGYYCHTPSDECVDDEDCAVDGGGPRVCTFDTTKAHWTCGSVALCP